MNHTDEHIDDELQQMSEMDRLKGSIHTAVSLADTIAGLKLQAYHVVPRDTLVKHAVKLMREQRTGCLLVTENDRLVGIFTERDVARKVVCADLNLKEDVVGDYMTTNPETLPPDAPIAFALNLMAIGGFRHVPLVDEDNKPQGFVSVRDIVNYIGDYYSRELLNLPPKPQGNAWQSVEGG